MSTRTLRASKRWLGVAAAAAVCVGTVAVSNTASAAITAPDDERISGANRFGTAVEIAEEFGVTCDYVIASGEDFPDGLASASFNKPILLTQAATLPADTLGYLVELVGTTTSPGPCAGGITTTVVGGPAVISSGQKEVLDDFGPSTRVSGANRYETAIEVAEAAYPGGTGVAIIATGANFPDALAGGVLAIDEGAPILLNDGDSVRSDVAAYLFDSDPTAGVAPVNTVYILGGTSAVPASVEAELKGALGIGTVERIAGSNRWATATEIAEEVFPAGPPAGNLVLANGFNFPDALAAAPFAAVAGAPIVLTAADSVPAPTVTYHQVFCDPIETIWAIGGTAAVSNAVVTAAVGAATCTAPDIVSATLANSDFTQAVFDLPTSAGTLTVSADAGSPADGAIANAWQVALIQNGTPGTEGVVLDPEGDDDAAYGGIPTFIMTANFTNLTNQGFVNVWNSSPAAALTTAATTDGAGEVGLVGSADPGAVAPLAGFATTLGSQDSTVVVTFSRAVDQADTTGLFPNLNPASAPSVLPPADTVTPTPVPTNGATVWTYTWDDVGDVPAEFGVVPTVGSYQIRYGIGDIIDAASGNPSAVPAAFTLTAP